MSAQHAQRNIQHHRTHHAHNHPKNYEDDPHRLQQRHKQITYGENTPGYQNFQRLLDKDPSLLQGCVPVKPCIYQRCSKRSWDGQVRKWRRALHMYDFVDFEDDAAKSAIIREALIEQNRNPMFATPHKSSPEDDEGEDGEPEVSPRTPEKPAPISPVQPTPERVRYSFDQMFEFLDSPHVAPRLALPDSLRYLDKNVDLEDELDEEGNLVPTLLSASPTQTGLSPDSRRLAFSPGLTTPARYSPNYTPLRQVSKASPRTPPATDVMDRYHAGIRAETDMQQWAATTAAVPQTP
eukprot:NODE_1945_length_1176_cov_107.004766_g1731_i1.p1 GENE.NODE_1945_length_1176_cov_107.004766_g1731_i1~~NODE_1945_length_1176_cov_107.004766_g1731_i1.p1  ORF type:complete len:294 (+),score=37.38 NODE_1945_length_1176_cov_107.004766_g1731_i1:91-972(+)